ncbi:hypothetical protein EG329_003769 [Mollisiaceae sp. DMI_Dod_QoI]|nr:hypothetical protein EG329_003769 [Helotiales sp. DMI_Dod_QoI]
MTLRTPKDQEVISSLYDFFKRIQSAPADWMKTYVADFSVCIAREDPELRQRLIDNLNGITLQPELPPPNSKTEMEIITEYCEMLNASAAGSIHLAPPQEGLKTAMETMQNDLHRPENASRRMYPIRIPTSDHSCHWILLVLQLTPQMRATCYNSLKHNVNCSNILRQVQNDAGPVPLSVSSDPGPQQNTFVADENYLYLLLIARLLASDASVPSDEEMRRQIPQFRQCLHEELGLKTLQQTFWQRESFAVLPSLAALQISPISGADLIIESAPSPSLFVPADDWLSGMQMDSPEELVAPQTPPTISPIQIETPSTYTVPSRPAARPRQPLPSSAPMASPATAPFLPAAQRQRRLAPKRLLKNSAPRSDLVGPNKIRSRKKVTKRLDPLAEPSIRRHTKKHHSNTLETLTSSLNFNEQPTFGEAASMVFHLRAAIAMRRCQITAPEARSDIASLYSRAYDRTHTEFAQRFARVRLAEYWAKTKTDAKGSARAMRHLFADDLIRMSITWESLKNTASRASKWCKLCDTFSELGEDSFTVTLAYTGSTRALERMGSGDWKSFLSQVASQRARMLQLLPHVTLAMKFVVGITQQLPILQIEQCSRSDNPHQFNGVTDTEFARLLTHAHPDP